MNINRFVIKILIVIIWILVASHWSIAQKKIPESKRSRQAIERVRPGLEKALAGQSLRLGSPIFIRIFKESNELEVWVKSKNVYEQFRTYEICDYSGNLGPKLIKGDNQSPEGFYFVTPNRLNPLSNFHLSFNIGYPNSYDRYHKRTGGAIMVHGNCVSIGCYAMTDKNIEQIYALADAAFRNGQGFFRVHIFPFHMTGENMEKHRNFKWISFWQNLKEGYDYFEQHRLPPNVVVRRGRYVFQTNFN